MTESELARVYGAIGALWPSRLVDPLPEDRIAFVAGIFDGISLDVAIAELQEYARSAESRYPPSWPALAERCRARLSGTHQDFGIVAGEWLAEVNAEVGRRGGCAYRPMPDFSDPIIPAAVRQAAGSWAEWGATTNGGPGDGGAFTRNLIPERDERFRRAVVAMLRHRRQTGERLPQITDRIRHDELMGGLRRIAIGRGDDDAS